LGLKEAVKNEEVPRQPGQQEQQTRARPQTGARAAPGGVGGGRREHWLSGGGGSRGGHLAAPVQKER